MSPLPQSRQLARSTGSRTSALRSQLGKLAPLGTCLIAGSLLAGLAPIASAAVPSGWSEIARDGFSRTVTGGWGAADLGGSYSLVPSGTTVVGTTGSAAFARMPTGKGATAQLADVTAADVDISDTTVFTVAAGTTFDAQHAWTARQQPDGSGYTARVRVNSAGKATLGVSRLNGTVATWLTGLTLPFTVSPGQVVRGELQVSGSAPVNVAVRAWIDGDPVPAWQINASDADPAQITQAGTVTVGDFNNSSTADVTATHDDLSVGSDDQPTPPGEPRGSVAVGTATYPVPASGALFVDAVGGSNSNSGTQAAPFKTVVYAVTKAVSGSTLVLRAGTYHESVTVASNKTMTIQNYPGEAVWFDGSVPVTSWAKAGSTWVTSGWNAEFSSMMGGDAAFKARFIDADPMAADPDQVFIDGSQLHQVSSAANVVAGTFYVSDSANTITIGSDPTGKQVRSSDLAQAMFLSGKDSVIQGIGVRRYANGYEIAGAVRLGNTGGTVRNVDIEDVATIGISISNTNKTIDHVTIQHAGLLGIGGYQNDNSTVTNSIVSNNNSHDFKDEPVAGGMKFTSARTMTIKNNEVNNNNGSGIWCDVSSYNLTIVNNTANGNTKHGIEMEISDTAIIANNQAINGGEDGIIIFDASNVKLFNNEVGGSSLFGIKLAQDERRQAQLGSFMEGRDSRYKNVVDPNITWITKNIQVSNNVFGKGGYFQLYGLDGRTKRAVDTWNLTIQGNLFNKRPTQADPTMVAWGKGDNITLERYESPAALATAKGSSWVNAQTTTSKSITAMGADKITYAASAIPIPADIAAATGLTAGARILGNG